MTSVRGAQFPVYIPSKSRATIALTPHALDAMGVPYRIIIEEPQYAAYRDVFGASRLLVLPREYVESYDPLMPLGPDESRGSGPARNFAWEHSMSEGHEWHWIIDDNIRGFYRLHQNRKRYAGDGMIFTAMEDFSTRYTNLGASGPEYDFFAPAREPRPQPFILNRKIFSCILLRNDTGLRWRGRYNEDLLLCIALLRAGWCTVHFLAFLQKKIPTQKMGGGNTEAFYGSEGTLAKSLLAVRQYPDIVTLTKRWGRWHHKVDWSEFENLRLIRRPDWQPPPENPYRTRTVPRPPPRKLSRGTSR